MDDLSGGERRVFNSLIVVIIGALLLIVIFFLGFRTVDAGEVAVVTKFGQVTGRVLSPGAHFIMPFVEGTTYYDTKKVIYETSTAEAQKGSKADYKDFPVDTNTEDGQSVDVFYTVRFSVDATKASWVAQNIGDENALVEKVVKTESRIWARNIPRRFSAETLYTGKGSEEVQKEIFDALNDTFSANGLILDSFGVREIKFAEAYIDAIEQKQIQAVRVETERNIAEQATYQKQARITSAEGQAKEQELQRQTISKELLQKMLIEKWNGNYPQYLILGDTGQFILPMPN